MEKIWCIHSVKKIHCKNELDYFLQYFNERDNELEKEYEYIVDNENISNNKKLSKITNILCTKVYNRTFFIQTIPESIYQQLLPGV